MPSTRGWPLQIWALASGWGYVYATGVPFPAAPSPPIDPRCQPKNVGCWSDGCIDFPNCPKTVERALGGDTAVHRFDAGCPSTDTKCPEGLKRQSCIDLCAFNNFNYAGLEAGRCCYCASEISSGPQVRKIPSSPRSRGQL
jgi:hypothetical protein